MPLSADDRRVGGELASTQTQKRPAEDPAVQPNARKRKEHKDELKAKKTSQIVAADELAQAIFQVQKPAVCIGCSELKNTIQNVQLECDEVKQALKAKILELEMPLEDFTSSIEAKKMVIKDLCDVVQRMELEYAQLKYKVEKCMVSLEGTYVDNYVYSA